MLSQDALEVLVTDVSDDEEVIRLGQNPPKKEIFSLKAPQSWIGQPAGLDWILRTRSLVLLEHLAVLI